MEYNIDDRDREKSGQLGSTVQIGSGYSYPSFEHGGSGGSVLHNHSLIIHILIVVASLLSLTTTTPDFVRWLLVQVVA
ncbi:hypothetical protein Pcinc_040778 [Petrolisthes cinctipes]|uniref:Uncharacterized protein n=1 Tax=Petrolisthes cinctipes TaxID=88211 RepID=A0AAE1BM83_PETCI|nr:hypothetical protein Pcinc_040778 [Petrolisthes cinctipes]